MSDSSRRSFAGSLLVAVAVLALAQPAIAQSYTVTDLGTLGGTSSSAYALNDLGHVVGRSRVEPNSLINHGFVWMYGNMIDLGGLAGSGATPNGINNQTQVTGASTTWYGYGHAFLWEDGEMVDLGPDWNVGSYAYDINDAVQITGQGQGGYAFLWEDGVWTSLGTLPGFSGSIGFGINSAGEVVGVALPCPFCGVRGFHWVDGVMTELPPLAGFVSSVAWGLNDLGSIVGYSNQIIPSGPRATLWQEDAAIDLGVGDGLVSEVFAVNNTGVIAGYWGTSDQGLHHYASKWVGGELIDLNDLILPDSGWTLHEAKDINESGQIVGWGLNPDGLGRGFLLTPCDFSAGPGEDCDDNGVPDECQMDCNDNGRPDVCDIADGISGDCDGDNVPDECDIGPPITQQPASQEVVAGDLVFFQVVADGLLLAYQWRKDGIDLSDTEHILGTQNSALVILDVQSGDAGEYDCVVTDLLDSSCSASDPATLTVVVTCPPDFDCDGDVDAADLAELLGNWGPCPDPDDCPADLDDDGAVNAFDLAQLLGSWGP